MTLVTPTAATRREAMGGARAKGQAAAEAEVEHARKDALLLELVRRQVGARGLHCHSART